LPRTSSRTSSDRPLEFFFDRSLGKISAHRLRDAGYTVHLIADFYPDDTQQIGDSEWIAEGCQRGWALLTKDQRIRYRTDELAALTDGHLFCLADGKRNPRHHRPALPESHARHPPRRTPHERRVLARPHRRPHHQDVAMTDPITTNPPPGAEPDTTGQPRTSHCYCATADPVHGASSRFWTNSPNSPKSKFRSATWLLRLG
jgi:hypothetical protein